MVKNIRKQNMAEMTNKHILCITDYSDISQICEKN